MTSKSPAPSNRELLERFWNRRSFHDEGVDVVFATKRRVVIRLESYTLVITDVSKFVKEWPESEDCWLCHSWETPAKDGFTLSIDLSAGKLRITGRDVRLLRNEDMAILLPPIDQ
jgi:hypothetical protein